RPLAGSADGREQAHYPARVSPTCRILPKHAAGQRLHQPDPDRRLCASRRLIRRKRKPGSSTAKVIRQENAKGMTDVRDSWAVGSIYENFMGRWSRRLATQFVSWLRIPAGVHWLDVGCGTGALANAICNYADPASVVGCD